MAKTVEDAVQTMIANFAKNTGRTRDAWVAIAKKSGAAKHREIVKFLKEKHGIGHGFANMVAAKTLEGDAGPVAGDDLVAGQYAGAKGVLKPVYDKLAATIGKFGADVEFAPKKAYVSLRRARQFGLIQPSTADRLDVGINLKGVAPTARLEATGSFNAMVSHRVHVTAAKDIDAQLIGWLRDAYNNA
jgi:hypothetical protein